MTSSSSTHPTTPRIAIIGAGLAGLSISLFLHRLNLPITIYESRPRDTSDGGFIALAPNAACVLDQLGVYQQLLTKGFAYEEYTFLSSRNCGKIATILNGSVRRYGYPALRISRHTLRQTLLEKVLEAGIEVKFEHKLTGIDETDSGVSLTLSTTSNTTTQTQTTEPFTYVLVSDGIHSKTRQLIFPSSPLPVYTGQLGLGGGQVSRSSLPATLPQPCLILGPGNSYMMMPSTPDGQTVNISATLEVPERSRAGWTELANDKATLKNMLVDRHCGSTSMWPKAVQESCRSAKAESLAIWPFYSAPILESWISSGGRVILLGDAAHAMPPTGGQGAAMAFEDAASLSLCFKKLTARSSEFGTLDISADLHAWQERRMKRVEQVKAFTSQGGDVRRATTGWVQMVIKEWLMWMVLWYRGEEGGFAWVYEYREEGVGAKIER